MAGFKWRIRFGAQVSILGQPWLPNDDNPCLSTENQALDGKKVSNLFCIDTNRWDENLIHDIFNEKEKKSNFEYSVESGGSTRLFVLE